MTTFDRADRHFRAGLSAKYEQEYRRAVDEFRKCIELNPGHALAHEQIGWLTYGALSRVDSSLDVAKGHLEKALELDPSLADAHLYLGLVLAQLERQGEADYHFRQCLALEGDSAIAHATYGSYLLECERIAEAELEFKKALALCPESITALRSYASLLGRTDRIDRAEELFQKAIQLDPKSHVTLHAYGRFLSFLSGRESTAEEFLRKALELNPAFIRARRHLDELLAFMKSRQHLDQLMTEQRAVQEFIVTEHRAASFWAWFSMNAERLANDLSIDESRVFEEFSQKFAIMDDALSYEIGIEDEGKHEFIVSSGGDLKRFPDVIRIARAAPFMARWKVVAFRPPRGIDIAIIVRDFTVDKRNVWFNAQSEGGGVRLRLYVRGLSDENCVYVRSMTWDLVYSVLGEYIASTKIRAFECHSATEHIGAADLFPLGELPAQMETLS